MLFLVLSFTKRVSSKNLHKRLDLKKNQIMSLHTWVVTVNHYGLECLKERPNSTNHSNELFILVVKLFQMLEEAIDGQAFLLLTYPTVRDHWQLKTTTAIQLCQHIESVRLAHITQF